MRERPPGYSARPRRASDPQASRERRPAAPCQPGSLQAREPRRDLRLLAATLTQLAEALQTAAREAERIALATEQAGKPTTPSEDRLLTVAEAAQTLRLSRSNLYTHVLCGDIPSLTLGRSRRISAAALAAWIERQQSEQC
jgi:excisionase family DNA binding protein